MDNEDSSFGKYRLVQQLATGGMAQLYLASIDGPDGFSKSCVIKRVLPEYASLESFSRMFADEAKVAALLTHPNIVQVFDFGRVDGQYYLAMEWIQGHSLDRLLRQAIRSGRVVGTRVAVDVGLAVADALAYAHAKTLPDGTPLKLVHRDVTPGNVLVSRDGIIKLADFGIVKSAVNAERTVAGVVKGKYPYMSPEQITSKELDHRSDLYSLGIVLYEAATGRRLFKRDTLEATIMAASQANVPPPSEGTPDFPSELERVLLRLLQKDPAARYQSARELRDDLERFRAAQQWASGTHEMAALVAELFPPGITGQPPTALPASSTSHGSNSATGRTPAPSAEPKRELSSTSAATRAHGAVEAPLDTGTQGFPWGIALAAGCAAVGTALFWLLAP